MSVDGLNTGIQVFLEKKKAILSQLLILLICIVQMKIFSVFYKSRLCRGISPEFLVLLFVIQLE